jgi:hypothetical protein
MVCKLPNENFEAFCCLVYLYTYKEPAGAIWNVCQCALQRESALQNRPCEVYVA